MTNWSFYLPYCCQFDKSSSNFFGLCYILPTFSPLTKLLLTKCSVNLKLSLTNITHYHKKLKPLPAALLSIWYVVLNQFAAAAAAGMRKSWFCLCESVDCCWPVFVRQASSYGGHRPPDIPLLLSTKKGQSMGQKWPILGSLGFHVPHFTIHTAAKSGHRVVIQPDRTMPKVLLK